MDQTLSKSSLIKATLLALISACVILTLFILPAEFNIDPTGVGKSLGLTVLSQTESKAAELNSSTESNTDMRSDTIEVSVPAGKGIEYKFYMEQYQKLTYEWLTDNGTLYFDLHGEPEGDTTGYFESYAEATLDTMKGSFTAPFTGSHGWYWKNTSDSTISVQLTVSGEYSIQGLK